jgi:hypothetical protein
VPADPIDRCPDRRWLRRGSMGRAVGPDVQLGHRGSQNPAEDWRPRRGGSRANPHHRAARYTSIVPLYDSGINSDGSRSRDAAGERQTARRDDRAMQRSRRGAAAPVLAAIGAVAHAHNG